MTDERIPAELETLLAEADAQAATPTGRPDFQDVLARAGRIAPHRFADAAGPGPGSGANVPVPSPVGPLGPLDDFVHDARAFVERRVESRQAEPLPPLPTPVRRRRVVGFAVAGMVAAAAAIVLVALQLAPAHRMVGQGTEAPGPYSEAPRSAHVHTTQGISQERQPERRRGTADVEPDALDEADGSDPALQDDPGDPAESIVEAAPADPPADPSSPEGAGKNAAKGRRSDHLAELDRQARQAWREGRIDTARRKFAELVRVGGRRDLVDVAYGDLFSLAQQGGANGELERLWRAYLRRFPRGRYADEARAGLCRRSSGDRQQACWQEYLDEAPRKTYEAEARRALRP